MLSNADQARIMSRRTKVAALLLRGTSNQYEICAQLGMEHSQQSVISKDIKAIKTEWRRSAVRDFDEAKGRELEKLEALEREAWEAWERSKLERTSSRTSKRSGAAPAESAELKKEKRDGNPKFLDVVLRCIAKRCEILGLTSGATPDGTSVTVVGGVDLQAILGDRENPLNERYWHAPPN